MSNSNWDVLIKFKDPAISGMMYVTATDKAAAEKRVRDIIAAENPKIDYREIRVEPGVAPPDFEYDFDNRGGLKLPPGSQVDSIQLPPFKDIKVWPV